MWEADLKGFFVKSATTLGVTTLLFVAMQMLGNRACFDCGAKIGFAFAYMQEETYGTHGHFIWGGFAADLSVALAVATLVVGLSFTEEFCHKSVSAEPPFAPLSPLC